MRRKVEIKDNMSLEQQKAVVEVQITRRPAFKGMGAFRMQKASCVALKTAGFVFAQQQ